MSMHDDHGRDLPIGDRIRLHQIREGRVRRVAFTASVVVHVLAIWLYSGIAGPPTVTVVPREAEGTPELTGIELLNLVELDDEELDDPERPEEPEVPPEVERQPIPVPVESTGQGDPDADEEIDAPVGPPAPTGLSAAERLRVRTYDERLWDFAPEDFEPTAERLLTAELAGMIDVWFDSLAAQQAREEALTDWTWTDENGDRWGVSPGRLHLGSLTLPLPFSFGIPPGRFEEYMERQYIDRELARNALTGVILESWAERNQAIRERMDREREEALRGSGPRRLVPDTVRRGGGGNGG